MTRRAGFFALVFLLAGCASAPAPEPAAPAPAGQVGPTGTSPDGNAGDGTASTEESAPAAEAPARDAGSSASADAAPLSTAPDAWQLLDLADDRVPGVSATRVYDELLAGRTPAREVVVAVIDGGVDTAHVDLRDNLWRNPGETPGNGVDDDGNGYVDDVFGWNFIGGADGRNVGHEQLEVTRLHVACQAGESAPAPLTCAGLATAYEEERTEVTQTLQILDQIEQAYAFALPLLTAAGAGDPPTPEGVRNVSSLRQDVIQARNLYLQLADAGILPEDLPEAREAYEGLRDYGLAPDFAPREIVGDDLSDGTERAYGNPDVMGPDAGHGTHVAGIIGAVRGNGIGIDGIATNVRIMAVRAVPDGDERDKDVANAIRYAVDNGAHIINMSFGKSYSPRKSLVDDAIRYADERGVPHGPCRGQRR